MRLLAKACAISARDSRVSVVTLQLARLQRLDMALDFDVGAEFAADLALEPGDDLMRIAMRHAAVDFDVETDRGPRIDFLNGDVMDRHMAFGRDQKNAFEHCFVSTATGCVVTVTETSGCRAVIAAATFALIAAAFSSGSVRGTVISMSPNTSAPAGRSADRLDLDHAGNRCAASVIFRGKAFRRRVDQCVDRAPADLTSRHRDEYRRRQAPPARRLVESRNARRRCPRSPRRS